MPVERPGGVTATVDGNVITAKGPNGELSFVLNDLVLAELGEDGITVTPRDQSRLARAQWGMSRTLISNIVTGVSKGFERKLLITGVGYRAAIQGSTLQLTLGFSHNVEYPIPDGIQIACPRPTEITVSGIDKQRVGQVAAEIRKYRPPEPYKGKGVRYDDEVIFRKEGKKK